jgi:molybdopterin-guanine dinucleotide biosynthesis protein A
LDYELPVASSQLPVKALPVHGFVLAGGKSSRMGQDKALLRFRGRPMVEIAVEKLREFCAEVSIAGNREDLREFAPVVCEERVDAGPGAGIEAGLKACTQPWAMFVPVDVPLVPAAFLQRYASCVLEMARGGGIALSHLSVTGDQPAFCMLRANKAGAFTAALEAGERRLSMLFHLAKGEHVHWVHDLYDIYGFPEYKGPDEATVEHWFANVNTREELEEAEADDADPLRG